MKGHLALSLLTLALTTSLGAQAQSASTLNVNIMQNFMTLDPAKISQYPQYLAAINLYDNLLGINSNDTLTPSIAQSWKVGLDAKTYVFTIGTGMKFHSGNPVTPQDVVYSMRRVLALNEGPAFLWREVLKPQNVTASGGTVRMVLNRPFSPFANTMSLLFIVDSKTLRAKKQAGKFGAEGDYGQAFLNANDAGSGPYTIGRYRDGEMLSLKRFAGYHEPARTGLFNTVNILRTASDQAAQILAEQGRIEMSSGFQQPSFYSAMSRQPGWKIITVPSRTMLYLKMNNQRAPFDDVNVRKAVAAAIDYKTLRTLYPGTAPQGVLAPSFRVHNKNIPTSKQDIAAAKALFAKSRYVGTKPVVELAYVDVLDFEREIGDLIQKNLAQIGITVKLTPMSWDRMVELASKPATTPQLSEIFFAPTYPSANSVFYTQYHSQAPGGWATSSWTKDAEVDKLIDQALDATDPILITGIYAKLQERLQAIMPDVPLVVQQTQYAVKTNIAGYQSNPVQSFDLNFFNLFRK